MASSDRSTRYRQRQLESGFTKVCVWVPAGSEDKVREMAARARARSEADKLAAQSGQPAQSAVDYAEFSSLAGFLRLIQAADRPATFEAGFRIVAELVGSGKSGASLEEARVLFKTLCVAAGLQPPGRRQLQDLLPRAQ
jgi:hypothetical protein